MDMIFQFINMDDGCRSNAFTSSREELAKSLVKSRPDFACGVLVLCDDVSGKFAISRAPFLTVDRFIELFGDRSDGGEIFSTASVESVPLQSGSGSSD